jgi:chromosome partitioning protein
MSVIAVINPKGGVGKTTITLNLGLFLSSQSKKIIFIDLDPQRSLSDLLKRRPKALSQYQCIKTNAESFNINDYQQPNKDIIYLIDCPAAMDGKYISKILSLSDILLIPVTPSPLDLGALTHFFFQLAVNDDHLLKNKPIALIANKAKLYTQAHNTILKKIAKFTIPLIGTCRDTQNYTLPATKGMGIIDLPAYRIKADLENWDTILGWIAKNNPCIS